MSFRDRAFEDMERSFFNQSEFGETRDVNGKKMHIVLVQNAVEASEDDQSFFNANNYTHTSGVVTRGVYRATWELHVPAAEFGPKPRQKSVVEIDRERRFLVISADDEMGVYRIELEEARA